MTAQEKIIAGVENSLKSVAIGTVAGVFVKNLMEFSPKKRAIVLAGLGLSVASSCSEGIKELIIEHKAAKKKTVATDNTEPYEPEAAGA